MTANQTPATETPAVCNLNRSQLLPGNCAFCGQHDQAHKPDPNFDAAAYERFMSF